MTLRRRGPELLTCLFLVSQASLLLMSAFLGAGTKSFEPMTRYLGITMYNLLVLKQHSPGDRPFKKKKRVRPENYLGLRHRPLAPSDGPD